MLKAVFAASTRMAAVNACTKRRTRMVAEDGARHLGDRRRCSYPAGCPSVDSGRRTKVGDQGER